MSDFEKWYENELSKIHYGQIKNGMKLCWQAAKQSMQGEAVGYVQYERNALNTLDDSGKIIKVPHAYLTREVIDGALLYTHAPDSAASIAEQKVPPGYALVPIVTTRAMDDVMRDPDWQWTDVLAAAESITEDDYLEPYPPQAAEKLAEQDSRIKELEQQLEAARKDAERYQKARLLGVHKRWVDGDSKSHHVTLYKDYADSFIDAAIRQIGGAE